MTYSTSTGTEVLGARGSPATRRAVLGALVAASLLGPLPAPAHTPYRQWKVYRQRHLVIGASQEDADSYPKAKAIQGFLDRQLPEARARVARARTRKRLADLLATDQLKVVLLSVADAAALMRGQAPFDAPVPDLGVLARFGNHVLCVRESFPAAHAWLLSRTLAEFPGAAVPSEPVVPVHQGSRAAAAGQPAPESPVDPELQMDPGPGAEVPHRH